MDIQFTMHDEWHAAVIRGEIDHHTAKPLMEQTSNYFETNMPLAFCFDMRGVGFMDSSGIALILGVARRMKSIGGRLRITGLQSQPKKVVRASGLEGFIEITEEGDKK